MELPWPSILNPQFQTQSARSGSDYGYDAPAPEGLEDISKLPAVTYALLERGYHEETVRKRKILGENTLRVMAEVERVARESAR